VATTVNTFAKIARREMLAASGIFVTVSARLHVTDSTLPAAMHVQHPAMAISHVSFV
jgi:hypothetical protein